MPSVSQGADVVLHRYGIVKNSPNGEDNPQEVGYRSDYTGAFITDWEIPMEPQGTREDPGVDFVVDWTN